MDEKTVLDREDVRRTLQRIAHEIVEKTGGEGVAVVGIHRRGAVLGARLRDLVAELVGEPVPLGASSVPAAGAHEAAGEVGDLRERLARLVVELRVSAEEEGVRGLAQERPLVGLEGLVALRRHDLHQPSVCLCALGGHPLPRVASLAAGTLARAFL